jgi:hypothetical protein|tara:strand:- start:5856 stop:6560 length:705 start_codon:yes stop_codon:yes gene_type:complete
MAQTYIIEGVEALWPKVDQTYAFDQMKNRSMPCGPRDPNAEFSIQFRMDAPAAKALFKVMKDTYAANREDNWSEKLVNPFVKDDDGTYTHKAVLKGAYGGQVTIAPVQYDSQGNELPKDFLLTTGSTVNVCVQMVPYNFGGKQAVSLRLRAIQVIKYVPLQTRNPFKVIDGGYVSAVPNPFKPAAPAAEAKPVVVQPVNDDDDDDDEPMVLETKTKKVANGAPVGEVLDEWDDD